MLDFVFSIAVLIMSVVIHEVSHGLAANALGDPTAKYEGRLTLNPLKHLDPVGSVLLPVFTYLIGGFFFLLGQARPLQSLQFKKSKMGSGTRRRGWPGFQYFCGLGFCRVAARFFRFRSGTARGHFYHHCFCKYPARGFQSRPHPASGRLQSPFCPSAGYVSPPAGGFGTIRLYDFAFVYLRSLALSYPARSSDIPVLGGGLN